MGIHDGSNEGRTTPWRPLSEDRSRGRRHGVLRRPLLAENPLEWGEIDVSGERDLDDALAADLGVGVVSLSSPRSSNADPGLRWDVTKGSAA